MPTNWDLKTKLLWMGGRQINRELEMPQGKSKRKPNHDHRMTFTLGELAQRRRQENGVSWRDS